MEYALNELRERGYTRVILWVLRENTNARGFYEHLGFTCTGDSMEGRIGGKLLTEVCYRIDLPARNGAGKGDTMIDPERYCSQLLAELKALFGSRLLFLGLQGSYLRGEATEESDIDIMAVIDELTPEDLDRYRTAVRNIGDAERACGFLCGREELSHWNPIECCQLIHTTKPVYGRLEPLLPPYDRRALSDYIRLGAGDLYHALCHRYLYADPEKNRRKLPDAERSVFFLLQNLLFYETGSFPGTRRELEPMLTGEDRTVWDTLKAIGREPEYDFDPAFRLILKWCGNVLARAANQQNERGNPIMKRLRPVGGTMGVGKTTVCRELRHRPDR